MNNLKKTKRQRAVITDAPLRVRRASRRADKVAATKEVPQGAGAPAGPTGKLGAIVALMRRPVGATVAQRSEATDWLPHSVRGALAGALKRKHGLTITSDKTDAGRVYRIAEADAGVTT
ncbi:MAG: DUF3489 domain-containing protein [Brevundimonas sp.]|uniref:DUF3489 domain-containing protein n=1 Tax=Brevundimonas sp. TaxID=1871086 RepID=UPI00391CF693